MARRVELHSPLPVDECARRLADRVDTRANPAARALLPRGRRWVVGRLKGAKALLWLERAFFGNAFRSYLDAELCADGGGSKLRGAFRMGRFTVVFLAAWFGMAAYLTGSTLVQAFRGPPGDPGADLVTALGGLGIASGGAGVVALGRRLGRCDERVVVAFLRETLRVRE